LIELISNFPKWEREFIQLTGNDDNALEFNKRGGIGTISVTANIAPKLCADFQKLSVSKEEDELIKLRNWIKSYNQYIAQCLLKVTRAQSSMLQN